MVLIAQLSLTILRDRNAWAFGFKILDDKCEQLGIKDTAFASKFKYRHPFWSSLHRYRIEHRYFPRVLY